MVLGDLRPKTTMHVITEIDPVTGALFARNPYNTEFPNRTAFFDVDDATRMVAATGRIPGAQRQARESGGDDPVALSGRVGRRPGPCAAIQVSFELADGQEREIVFRLGVGGTLRMPATWCVASGICRRARRARNGLAITAAHARRRECETPDQSLNVLANGWLLYQTLACRLWARSRLLPVRGRLRFSRSVAGHDGAHPHEPRLALNTSFLPQAVIPEGDVQHGGTLLKAARAYTLLRRLPLAALGDMRYVGAPGTPAHGMEPIHFLQAPINENEDSYYDLPGRSREAASLYDHC